MTDVFNRIQDGAVARITIDRQEKGNALSLPLAERLGALIRQCAADPVTRVVVLRGAGENFCSGRDRSDDPPNDFTTAPEFRAALADQVLSLFSAVREAPVPVVALVQGRATGLGCALAASCDITIAADNAEFGIPAMRHDRPPTLALSGHFDRVPPKALLWMVYTARRIGAADARAIGLVSHVAPPEMLDAELERVLEEVTRAGREALIAVKTYVREARLLDAAAATDLGGDMMAAFELSSYTKLR